MSALALIGTYGVRVRLASTGAIQAAPAHAITPALRELIATHAAELRRELAAVSAGALAPETTETPPSQYGTGRTTWGAPLPPPLPLVLCADCEHFRRNKANPLAGVGRCRLGQPDGPNNLPQYPNAPRLCGCFRDDSG